VNRPSLIHPKLTDSLPDFYSSLCTIQQTTKTQDTYKDEIDTWATIHTGVPCAIAPPGSGGKGEVKLPDQTYTVATHLVSLAGHYDDITTKMRATVDGLTLDIIQVVNDSHQTMTRLMCQVVT
jgi:head-tail adaptor